MDLLLLHRLVYLSWVCNTSTFLGNIHLSVYIYTVMTDLHDISMIDLVWLHQINLFMSLRSAFLTQVVLNRFMHHHI